MIVISIDGLLFSPLVLFISIACILTIITNLTIPRILNHYTNLKPSWLNLLLFICYLGVSMFLLGG
ncbi:hypothetical protein [Francisella sciaenopsi]|uniref:DUF1656 domain-containing protein n=1 Tax=Francisella sciaenopsi TaxID=3055034 RepID=A0ABQ6PF16_9GAMM